MRFEERLTDRLIHENEQTHLLDEASYLPKANEELIVTRLGLYEDLGFSPLELADLLLTLPAIEADADRQDLIRIAKKRMERLDTSGYYIFSK